ncbi:MAG: FAD/NAD(P)-binding oxidoreductase [Turneriella sp.]
MAAAKSKVKKQKTIIIVGGALAGPTAAARAREIDEHARIILLERNTRVSYAMSGLALHLSGEVTSLDELNREREDFLRRSTMLKFVHAPKSPLSIRRKNASKLPPAASAKPWLTMR